MSRIVNQKEFTAKRNEILDFAQKLIYTKGYTQMTIQDILDGLKISKGALYHYFYSKEKILEALVDRMGENAKRYIITIEQDKNLSAIQKFHSYITSSASWKNQQKELIISLMRMWYTDDNLFIRQKLNNESMKYVSPFFESIIRQGIKEKVFKTRFPAQVAIIISGIALSLSDTIIELLISNPKQPSFQRFEDIMDAYFETIEHILQAPSGSLKVRELSDFKDWFGVIQPKTK
ncbi:MAG TPA: TetR/AcrR family transcriptional regulator [Patescibacteria group bacterium]|nr:TetR/AcrR family transcriptional regulator [Patescibacteria group bacterium]